MRFIRKNGRIIPIRVDRRVETAKGAGIAAGGVAVAVGTGAGVAKYVQKAQKLAQEGRVQHKAATAMLKHFAKDLPSAQNPLYKASEFHLKDAGKKLLKAKKMFHARNALIAAGALTAGVLVGEGAKKVAEAWNGKHKDSKTVKTATKVAAYAGTIGAALTYGSYYSKLGLKAGQIAANVGARVAGKPSPFKKFLGKKPI